MKNCPSALRTHLAGGQITCAYIWKVKRLDGLILGFTNHDRDIAFDAGDGDGSVVYAASTGLATTAISTKSNLSVDNMEATAFLNSSAITERDLRANLYDYSDIKVMVANWADLTMGCMIVRRGTLGIVKLVNGQFTAELRGMTDRLRTVLGASYGATCRAEFGSGLNGIDMDSKYLCMIDVTAYRQTGTAYAQGGDPRLITLHGSILMPGTSTPTAVAPDDWFEDGIINFTSGVLNGFSFEIKSSTKSSLATVTLFLPVPFPCADGDAFMIEPGCNKTPAVCTNKFHNIVNLRAEPFIPGMDHYLDVPGGGGGLG